MNRGRAWCGRTGREVSLSGGRGNTNYPTMPLQRPSAFNGCRVAPNFRSGAKCLIQQTQFAPGGSVAPRATRHPAPSEASAEATPPVGPSVRRRNLPGSGRSLVRLRTPCSRRRLHGPGKRVRRATRRSLATTGATNVRRGPLRPTGAGCRRRVVRRSNRHSRTSRSPDRSRWLRRHCPPLGCRGRAS